MSLTPATHNPALEKHVHVSDSLETITEGLCLPSLRTLQRHPLSDHPHQPNALRSPETRPTLCERGCQQTAKRAGGRRSRKEDGATKPELGAFVPA